MTTSGARRTWPDPTPRRSRRAALAILAAGPAAAFLAACRRDEARTPAQVAEPPRKVRAAAPGPAGPPRRGGVLRHRIADDYANLDPHASGHASAGWVGMLALSRLLRFACGPGEDNLAAVVRPELTTHAGEYVEPDTVRFTLRPNALFADVPPVHGRAVTATDVRLSFERMRALKGGAALALVAAVQTPDDADAPNRTVVLKLKRPSVTLPSLLAAGGLFVMPYEADVRFDPARTPIGAGPWLLDRLEPAVQARWKPNPRWPLAVQDGQTLPFVEALIDKVIPEDGTAVAQFSAGEIDIAEMSARDLFAIEDAVPDAQVVAFPQQGFSFMGFSARPGQPFRDLRVRQAFSTALDRAALANVSYDTDKLDQAGYSVLRDLPAAPLPARSPLWIDPRMQPWGRAYEHRPDEARRLLEAAGWDFERTVPLNFALNRYGRDYTDSVAAVVQLLGQVGVKAQATGHDAGTAWNDVWLKGEFDGIGYFVVPRLAEPHEYFSRLLHSAGPYNPGRIRDRFLDALIEREDTYADPLDRQSFVRAILNHANENLYIPPLAVGTTMQYNVAQPWVGNVQQYFTPQPGAAYAEAYPHYWSARA